MQHNDDICQYSSVILTISAGPGGLRSASWVRTLMRMYLRSAEHLGLKCEILGISYVDVQNSDEYVNLASILFEGDGAHDLYSPEAGIHCLKSNLVSPSGLVATSNQQSSLATVRILGVNDNVILRNHDNVTLDSFEKNNQFISNDCTTPDEYRRTYMMSPIYLVIDHVTNHQETYVQAVLDGGLKPFMDAYKKMLSSGEKPTHH